MALKRICVVLILLLLAEWASGLPSSGPVLTPSQPPRVSRRVVPLALRYSRQLRTHIAVLPPGERQRPTAEPPLAPSPAGEVQVPSPPPADPLYAFMSLQR